MDRQQVYEKVLEICREVFDNEELELFENTTMDDVEEWDSLSHLTLISTIEENFDIEFKMDDIMNANEIGSLVDTIAKNIS